MSLPHRIFACAVLALPAVAAAQSTQRFDFAGGLQGWSGGFADYPSGEEEFHELGWEARPLPAEIDPTRGSFFITGNNHSDDLFLFLKRAIGGLAPLTDYRVGIKVEFATNAPSDCAGIGGAPGTGVTMKAGAVTAEPLAAPCPAAADPDCPADGYVLLSIDKGNQAAGGEDMAVLGHIGNDRLCPDETYELKTLGQDAAPFSVTTNSSGSFWAIIGTDSGFEGVTSLHYSLIEITIEESGAIRRGDADLDGVLDAGDAVAILFHLFTDAFELPCTPAGDADGSGKVALVDAVSLLAFLFQGGAAPPRLTAGELEACQAGAQFALTSPAFAEGEVIPVAHTCSGANTSPALAWSEVPPGTRSFALTCVDPDATSGNFVHWVAWNIPATAVSLAVDEAPPAEGLNGASRTGYTGPCPPRGDGFHRYFFTLHALDVETLPLTSTARLANLEAAMAGHVLGTAGVMGRYRRD